MNEPAPPGYYYQPPGGGYAQYIGHSIPSNFELPPMAPHYSDPNVPSPMPGFYHIDSFGNPPEYLGINPPRRAGGQQYQKQTMSSSSTGHQHQKQPIPSSSAGMSRRSRIPETSQPKESYIEYGIVKTQEYPQGKVIYAYSESADGTQYVASENQSMHSTPSNRRQSPQKIDRKSPKIKSTNESSPSKDYIPPFNTRPQSYGGPQNNIKHRSETQDSYQWPRQDYGQGTPFSSQRDNIRDIPSSSLGGSYHPNDERAPTQREQYGIRNQSSMQSSYQDSVHGSNILSSDSAYNTTYKLQAAQNLLQKLPHDTGHDERHEQFQHPQTHGHSHGGIRFGQ